MPTMAAVISVVSVPARSALSPNPDTSGLRLGQKDLKPATAIPMELKFAKLQRATDRTA